MKIEREAYFQRFHAEGRVVLKVDAPPEYGQIVMEALVYPGVVTATPKLDFVRFTEELIAKGLSPDTAGKIATGLRIFEDEAYFVPGRG
jgi:hypothetical protein